MLLSSDAESWFDNFDLTVDTFTTGHPTVYNLVGPGTQRINPREMGWFFNTATSPFPRLEDESNGNTPGPSPTALVAHLSSSLAFSCRLRMTHEKEADDLLETARSHYQALEDPIEFSFASYEAIEAWREELPSFEPI